MRMTDEMDRLILASVSDDFVTMESIVDKLSQPGQRHALNAGDLHRRFLDLIADRLVNAYLLHADPPYITPMEIGYDALWSCWFLITQRGKKCLAQPGRKRASAQPADTDSRDRTRFTSALHF